MAAIRCSSVIALFICVRPFEVADVFEDLLFCSLRDEFLALIGIFPDMYLAALPAPGLIGGKRRAMIEVDRGMMVVSSSYSTALLVTIHGQLEAKLSPSLPSSL